VFAITGHLAGQQIQTIALPVDAFHQVTIFTIPNEVSLQALFATDPNAKLVDPFANNNPNTNAFHMHQVMYLPPRFVNLFLD